jgi:metal-responsive CopG/Arc/MetJ family transcriptional regulator
MQDMNRIRRPTNITLDPELIDELDAWIVRQPLRVARSVVIEEAIRQYLDRDRRKQK